MSFSPTEAWEIGIDYWSFDYTNVIIEQNAQALLNAAAQGNAQARAQVIRDAASGLLLRVDSFYANASALETDGFDLAVRASSSCAAAARCASAPTRRSSRATTCRTRRPARSTAPGGATSRTSARRRPSGSSTRSSQWQTERHAVNAFVRYIDSYVDDEVDIGQGSRVLPADRQPGHASTRSTR